MPEPFIDSLYLALTKHLHDAEVRPLQVDNDGLAGMVRVILPDGQMFIIRFFQP